MTKIRILEPTVKSFSITITVPATKSITIFSNMDINNWEKIFLTKMNTEKDISEKTYHNLCWATLKWAIDCTANLANVTNGSDSNNKKNIEFTFNFEDLENMLNFKTYLKSKVESAMLY